MNCTFKLIILKRLLTTLGYLSGLFLCTAAFAGWTVPSLITTSPGPGVFLALTESQTSSQRTFYATEGDTLHVVWMVQSGLATNIHYKHSYDGGLSWSEDMPLTSIPDGDITALYPCLSVVGADVYVVWLYGELFTAEGVVLRHSGDAGQTWSDSVFIAPGYGGEIGAVNPMIVAQGNQLHVCWSGYSTDPNDSRAKTYYCSSFDGGETWTTPVQISQHSPASNLRSIQTAMAVDGGAIHLSWVAFGPNEIAYLFYRRSTDSGTTWETPVQIENSPNRSFAPCLAVTSESTVHLAWEDNISGGMGGNWSIKYTRSLDGGATWTDPIPMDSNLPGLFSGGAFLQPQGSQVFLTYNRRLNDSQYDIHFRKSRDEGAVWGEDTILVRSGLMPSMSATASRLYMVYTGQFFNFISFMSTDYDTANHVPPGFNLLLPDDRAVLLPSAADTVTFVWETSTDPDAGQTVRYGLYVRVTPPHSEPVELEVTNLLDTTYTINLLSEAGFPLPSDTLNVQWWVIASSNGDSVHCNSDFRFKVAPVHSGIDRLGSPQTFDLITAYPNPFNATAEIRFDLGTAQRVDVRIYDILGKELALLSDQFWAAGSHVLSFNAAGWPTGLYFCRVSAQNGFQKTLKLMLLK